MPQMTSFDLPLLSVKDLKVNFFLKKDTLKAVDGVNINIFQNETIGLVGESGCGKSVFALSLLRLISPPGFIKNGNILWKDKNILEFNKKQLLHLRGKEIAIIFQNPQQSLNPVYTIGNQIISVIRIHNNISQESAKKEALNLLNMVKIPDPERILMSYPHELSGGMCQRIMIAMAISCRPKLLIADEPTASLDVTIQAQIMDLLLEIKKQYEMSILFISHDLGVISRMCDRVAVMYLGKIIELSDIKDFFKRPLHPYSEGLLQSLPIPDPEKNNGEISKIKGDIPSPTNIPSGCRFRTRCPKAFDLCNVKEPDLYSYGDNKRLVACHLYI